MSFRFETSVITFDATNDFGDGSRSAVDIFPPTGERIMYAYMTPTSLGGPSPRDSETALAPSSYSLDGSSRIDGVTFIAPSDAGDRIACVCYYTI